MGNYLGEFTDEINKAGDNDFITKFVSGGAKNYAFETNNGISKAIVKGFSLNHVAIQTINYDSIQKIVTDFKVRHLALINLFLNVTKQTGKIQQK